MEISVDISLYPIADNFINPIDEFLNHLSANKTINISTGKMSTIITGKYEDVMDVLNNTIKPAFERNLAVFVIKITNACDFCVS